MGRCCLTTRKSVGRGLPPRYVPIEPHEEPPMEEREEEPAPEESEGLKEPSEEEVRENTPEEEAAPEGSPYGSEPLTPSHYSSDREDPPPPTIGWTK